MLAQCPGRARTGEQDEKFPARLTSSRPGLPLSLQPRRGHRRSPEIRKPLTGQALRQGGTVAARSLSRIFIQKSNKLVRYFRFLPSNRTACPVMHGRKGRGCGGAAAPRAVPRRATVGRSRKPQQVRRALPTGFTFRPRSQRSFPPPGPARTGTVLYSAVSPDQKQDESHQQRGHDQRPYACGKPTPPFRKARGALQLHRGGIEFRARPESGGQSGQI